MIIKTKDWSRPTLKVDSNIENKVQAILASIQSEGDNAIDRFSLEFDQQPGKVITLKAFEDYPLKDDLAKSIKLAANRIEKFSLFQKQGSRSKSFSDEFGCYGQVVSPVERVGAYIPGGRYPLISTALMTLIPARIAGSPVRIACSPSDHPAILASASLAGATQFIQLGGIQAIGALAYGFRNNLPVDVIVGPGNAWVNEAKKQLQCRVKIDGLAGPSELLALCDGKQSVEWLAYDALAQAEHDPLACSLIVSDNANWLVSMLSFLEKNCQTKKILQQKQIELVYAESVEELVNFSNQYAPEHLILCHQNIDQTLLSNYGSLFIGANSAVALGDYITGPNHTLPTLGYARQNGGLNVNIFLRFLTTQMVNEVGRQALSKIAMPIAKAEGLNYHYKSLEIRLNK